MDEDKKVENIREVMEDLSKGQEKITEELTSGAAEGIKDAEKVFSEEDKKESEMIEHRKKKIMGFFKKSNLWVLGFLIIAVILGVYIRSSPMTDHGGHPGLWDITTDSWTLGPDLDPFLFLRQAETIVENGSLPKIDEMRNVPLGFETTRETMLLPYMIAGTYWVLNSFSNTSIEYAAVIFPVIMFALTIIAFFLFVREIFTRKSKESKTKANIIALISTFFMIVIPVFLSRTIAGIPEKESAGFFFMFLAFYLFLKAWKSEKLKDLIIMAILAGISTALMGLIWGGVLYIFVTIAIANFIGFVLNKINKKEFLIYASWIITSFFVILLFSNRLSLGGLKKFLVSLDTGLAFLVLIIFSVHFLIWNTKISKTKFLKETKIPKNIISLIAAILLIIIFSSIFFGIGFMLDKIKDVNEILFTPSTGRWSRTVAENRRPFFTEWSSSFGPFIKNIPILFWLFFIGSVVLFKKMLEHIRKKDAWILTGFYVLFFIGLVFSRYSADSVFNGENFISRSFYYFVIFLLIGSFLYYYLKYHKERNQSFEKIRYEYIFLFSLFAFCLFTARGAVRLIMVLAPIAPIFLSYLAVETTDKFRKAKEKNWKMIFGGIVILIIVLSLFSFWSFYQQSKTQAYSFVPSNYNQQWQKAMSWVRENTSKEAVFAHWWDYGYWVQTLGNRATVLDGGNAIVYWNYLMGRHVLTGNNQEEALEFLYTHNATHLLIDSSDIGKYTAFSSIGSNENYDRYSWIPTMLSNKNQAQETRNGEIRTYQRATALDQDILYEKNGEEIFLPSGNTVLVGIIIENIKTENQISFEQPEAVFQYQNQQIKIPMKYIYYNGEFFDYGSGLEATTYLFQKIETENGKVTIDDLGALMYLSPRLMKGFLAQKYVLNDPFNNFPNFEIIHKEQSFIVKNLKENGFSDISDFVYYRGVEGPIKIWKINYIGDEKENEIWKKREPPESVTWEF